MADGVTNPAAPASPGARARPAPGYQTVLQGQPALVTGANSGIGKAVALGLGASGANVVVNFVTNPEAASGCFEVESIAALTDRAPRTVRHGGRAVTAADYEDLAHLALLLLRCAGIPARYVSGYLHPRPEVAIGEVVHGESHAWVEIWLGRWVPADPTNGVAVGPEHVVVARGRDYSDVPPLRGLYSGSAGSSLTVSVSVQRLR